MELKKPVAWTDEKFERFVLADILNAHSYRTDQRKRRGDPGWNACSCGLWEGYWSGFHDHVSARINEEFVAVLRHKDKVSNEAETLRKLVKRIDKSPAVTWGGNGGVKSLILTEVERLESQTKK